VKARQVIDENKQTLNDRQQAAIDALKAIMHERGDSAEAVEMAATIAAERFQSNRVYVGKLVDHGSAPYDFKKDNEQNYYVKLQTAQGEKVVWGVDFQRALNESTAARGSDVALVYEGRKPVTVDAKIRDAQGNVIDVQSITTNRNKWDVQRLDQLREDVKERLTSASKMTDKAPLIKVYDSKAPRPEREIADRDQSKQRARSQEHARG
jgi:hypothetical protein